jgi:outer membrane protein assembly factor BamB
MLGKNPPPPGGGSLGGGGVSVNDTFSASSAECDWVVQEEPIVASYGAPLPTGFWDRPINGENSDWTVIGGDWLNIDPGRWGTNPLSKGPESAHVMWTKPIAFGGTVGTAYQDPLYYSGLAYETKFGSPLIMNGRLYYPLPLGTAGSGGGYTCVDLRTGETIWTVKNVTSMSFGQNYDYISPNEFGIKPYLWRSGGGFGAPSSYQIFDPFSGEWLFDIQNVTSGTVTEGPNGEIITYTLNGANSWICRWNSTKCITYYLQSNLWMWRPQGLKMDWKYGIEYNVTTNVYRQPANQAISAIDVDTGVILAFAYQGYSVNPWIMEIGYSTKDGHEMWHVNRTAPFAGGGISWSTLTLSNMVGNGVFVEFYPEVMQWYGYDLTTGERIWGPTERYPNAWGMYSWQARIMYGKLIAVDFAGRVHAYNIHTGVEEWVYYSGDAGYDTPYGVYVLELPLMAADGKIYVSHGHGYSPPIFKGATLDCLNATDGTLIWNILQFNDRTGMAIADGYVIVYNIYDGQVYCFGKGPSVTTVTAPKTAITLGSSVVIEGTVVDTSAGAQSLVDEGKFASVACMSDESQRGWMEYLYEQQSLPHNLTGVEVTLDSIDPNGNAVPIGTATTDESGTYNFLWEPPIEGKYTIIATFAGSKAYGSSYAETALAAAKAPETQTSEPVVQPADYTMVLYGIAAAAIAIIIAVVIVGILILRKRT